MALYSDILLTVDYDRTLTAPDSTIPENNLAAIRYFMEQGGAFTVNTGRSVPMTRAFRDLVPVNAPLLLYNGSAAYDLRRGELTACREIQLDMARTIRECMEAFPDTTVEVQGVDAHYCFNHNAAWAAFCRSAQCDCRFARPEDDLGPFLKFSFYGTFHDDSVSDLFRGTPQEVRRMDEIEQALRQRYGAWCEVFRAGPRIIDVHAKGVSKGRSARALQRKLGKKILVCVGDAENDLPMLQDTDYAFAPADGVVADRFPTVCPCAEGAVAEVIYKKVPEILKNTLDSPALL